MDEVGGIIANLYPGSRLSSVKQYRKGLINKTYSLEVNGKKLVLRVYPKDFWKAEKEKYVYALVKNKIPVPKIVAGRKNFLLMERVEGKEFGLDNKNLVKEAGAILAKIHSVKFPYYGWIIRDKIKPKFSNWSDFINYDINSKFRKIPYKSLKQKVKKIIDEHRDLLNVKTKPCLLHKDYHASHIIADKGKISGIIDFEWAIAGHNELDIVKSCLWMFENKKDLEKIFLDGYKQYGEISKDFSKRRKLYEILTLLSSLSFSYECKHKKWRIYNYKKLLGALK